MCIELHSWVHLIHTSYSRDWRLATDQSNKARYGADLQEGRWNFQSRQTNRPVKMVLLCLKIHHARPNRRRPTKQYPLALLQTQPTSPTWVRWRLQPHLHPPMERGRPLHLHLPEQLPHHVRRGLQRLVSPRKASPPTRAEGYGQGEGRAERQVSGEICHECTVDDWHE